MRIDQKLPHWLSSGLLIPRVILAATVPTAVIGLLCIRSDDARLNYIGEGLTIFLVAADVLLGAVLLIRQRGRFVKNFFIEIIAYSAILCRWRWRTLSHMAAAPMRVQLLWTLLGAAMMAVFFESMDVALPGRSRSKALVQRSLPEQ
jgi:hypothetical protein